MKIDYYKIITTDFKEILDDDRYEELKEKGILERNLYLKSTVAQKSKRYLSNRANEIANNKSEYKNLTPAERAIVTVNIAYDDKKFCEALAADGYTAEELERFIKWLGYIKIKRSSRKYTNVDALYEKEINMRAFMLLEHFQKYFGASDINIIINKINEILSYQRDLLEEMRVSRGR